MYNKTVKKQNVVLKIFLIIFVSILLIFISAIALDYFFFAKSTSIQEYYYCKRYFDKNHTYYYDKNDKYFVLVKDENTDIPLVKYYWSTPIIVDKFYTEDKVGFIGIVNHEGLCRIRNFDLSFSKLVPDKQKGMNTDVMKKGTFVSADIALESIKIGEKQDVILFDQEAFDSIKSTFCDDGVATNLFGDNRDLCAMEEFLELEFDSYYNFVIALD
jgi:hypothetical protein